MSSPKTVLAALLALALLPAAAAPTLAATAPSGSKRGKATGFAHALLSSHELWATIDVCNPADQPYTVGIRGSMPGDGHARDKMYMSFRLQYLSATSGQWMNLSGASSSFISVGSGAAARQDGRDFELAPARTAVTLRGVVDFQWRRGATVLLSAARPTTAGHTSLAGADPAGFSAAACPIG